MHLQIRIICMTPADRLSTLRPLNFAPCFLLPADAPLIHGKSSPAILRFLPPPLSLLRSGTIKRHEALHSPEIGKAFPRSGERLFIQKYCERTPLAALPDSFSPVIITGKRKAAKDWRLCSVTERMCIWHGIHTHQAPHCGGIAR